VTYVLRCEFGVEDVRRDDVADRVAGVERRVVDSLLGLSGAIGPHPSECVS
jgi:hypothetical protein